MNNKTYLIIGGTGGIGEAMVKQLVQELAADQTDGASPEAAPPVPQGPAVDAHR